MDASQSLPRRTLRTSDEIDAEEAMNVALFPPPIATIGYHASVAQDGQLLAPPRLEVRSGTIEVALAGGAGYRVVGTVTRLDRLRSFAVADVQTTDGEQAIYLLVLETLPATVGAASFVPAWPDFAETADAVLAAAQARTITPDDRAASRAA